MIDVLKTIKIDDELITLFGKIDEEKHSVEFNYHVINKASMELRENIIRYPKHDMSVHDMDAHQYSMYGCKFLKSQLSFSKEGVVTIYGVFDRLVKEQEISKNYNTVVFSFQGIEKFFQLENFTTKYDYESGEISFSKPKNYVSRYTLYEKVEYSVESQFDGIVESEGLYELDVKQKKVIRVRTNSPKSIDELLTLVDKTKKYFEFVLKQEVLIDSVEFCDSDKSYRSSKLIFDTILQPKTFIKDIRNNPYPESVDALFSGLDGWLKSYDKYSDVIKIWQKSIYNINVADEDLFIWRCQAFELLCTINDDIYDKAFSLKERKQIYPNLKNFLIATSKLLNMFEELDKKYFSDVKNVRDKLIHNNPNKHVTEIQIENSQKLIEFFLIKTMSHIWGINWASISGFFIKPY